MPDFPNLIPRSRYMNKEVTYHEYYGQFVTDAIKDRVVNAIGLARIVGSTDEHFNDIPLKEWDALHDTIVLLAGRHIAAANGGGLSLSDTGCVAKTAARQVRAAQQ